jgi:hypothetical protein
MMKTHCSILLILLLTACQKTNNTPSAEFFPNQVGDHWVYKYSLSLSPDIDTGLIKVDIVGQITLPDGEKAKIWATRYSNDPNNIDTSYVVSDASLVKIYNGDICLPCTTQMPGERRRYILPLAVNNKWYSALVFGDTTKVLSELNLSTPAGIFKNTFQLSKTIGYAVNSYTIDTIFLSSNIGMTKFIQEEYSLGPFPGNGIWKLAGYSLK